MNMCRSIEQVWPQSSGSSSLACSHEQRQEYDLQQRRADVLYHHRLRLEQKHHTERSQEPPIYRTGAESDHRRICGGCSAATGLHLLTPLRGRHVRQRVHIRAEPQSGELVFIQHLLTARNRCRLAARPESACVERNSQRHHQDQDACHAARCREQW